MGYKTMNNMDENLTWNWNMLNMKELWFLLLSKYSHIFHNHVELNTYIKGKKKRKEEYKPKIAKHKKH
jgi:hypothetical protein